MNTFPECEQFTGRVKQICRCEVLTPEKCNQYRDKMGLPMLSINGEPVPLTAWQRIKSVTKIMSHTAVQAFSTGQAFVSEDVRAYRFAICQTCEHYANGQCAMCGCACNGNGNLANKLAHASAACPLTPPKWGQANPASAPRSGHPPLIGIPIDRSKLVSHILYHLMPLAGQSEWIWRRQVEWLREVRPQYNGRLIVGVITKSPNDHYDYVSTSEVEAAFAGMDAEFVFAENESHAGRGRGRGEGLTFPLMLAKIETTNPNEVFFYGHAKAVTHPDQPLGAPVHLWTEALFEASFGNRDKMIAALDRHGIVGSFRVPPDNAGRGYSRRGWHYSGTFWACRSVDVFRRGWRQLKSFYGCVEMWPNLIFGSDEGECLFLDNIPKSQLLYTPGYWAQVVSPEWTKWKAERDKKLSVTLATVVYNPSAACVANLNRVFEETRTELGCVEMQSVVIDNSPQPTPGIIADVVHWNGGANNHWGGAINQAVSMATGDYFVHFSAPRTRVKNNAWIHALLAPLSDPSCGMAGPVQRVPFHLIGETNPRPGQPEVHVQQAICAARTEVLRRFPWGAKYPHTYSDVWQSWSMLAGGLRLVDVREVTSAAGMEQCKPGALLACVAEKL